ncbi:MAG TPA: hypothetical protein VMM79_16165 [Longimicrobiales bacterium]|jgi:hypothetical protein|nr:hypothetical protein [Longimicrobiales bacterium]
MFNDWKQAWREAVDNFRRELSGDEGTADSRTRAMQREFSSAQSAMDKLDGEIRRTRREAGEERENEQICRRREEMAKKIDDEETIRIAAEFAIRHAERAAILERKVEVLVQERQLVERDLDSMKQVLAERGVSRPGLNAEPKQELREIFEERERENRDFSRLEREERERAAAERLEELKRKMK